MGVELNNRLLELLDPRDRPKGRAGWTSAEAAQKETTRLEREEQNSFRGWLERREFAYYHSGTHKPTSANLGVPDFIIGCRIGLAIEFKRKGGRLSLEQERWRTRHEARGGIYQVVTTYQQAVAVCEALEK
jgi:hypothetical protein